MHDAIAAPAAGPGVAGPGLEDSGVAGRGGRRSPVWRSAVNGWRQPVLVGLGTIAVVATGIGLLGGGSPAQKSGVSHIARPAIQSAAIVEKATDIPGQLRIRRADPDHRRGRTIPDRSARHVIRARAAAMPVRTVPSAPASSGSTDTAGSAPPSSATDAASSLASQSGTSGTAAPDVQQSSATASQNSSPSPGPTGAGALLGPGSTPSG